MSEMSDEIRDYNDNDNNYTGNKAAAVNTIRIGLNLIELILKLLILPEKDIYQPSIHRIR